MRRFIVICLIFLFPLQVFADSADYPTTPLAASDLLSQTEAVSDEIGGLASLVAAFCGEDGFDQPPAHFDFTDALVQEKSVELADDRDVSKPSYVPLPEYALFLPLIKPPPLLRALTAA